MGALAEDHLNDVVSNAGAIITATIASRVKGAWFVDPLGAIVISLWIISRWIGLTYVQVRTSFCSGMLSLHPMVYLQCSRWQGFVALQLETFLAGHQLHIHLMLMPLFTYVWLKMGEFYQLDHC